MTPEPRTLFSYYAVNRISPIKYIQNNNENELQNFTLPLVTCRILAFLLFVLHVHLRPDSVVHSSIKGNIIGRQLLTVASAGIDHASQHF